MSQIDNVYLSIGGDDIAFAPSADLEPPDAQLIVRDVTWVYGNASQYLEQNCAVRGTTLGYPYKGTFQITGIDGDYKTVWLAPV
jgi:hypothetical protein